MTEREKEEEEGREAAGAFFLYPPPLFLGVGVWGIEGGKAAQANKWSWACLCRQEENTAAKVNISRQARRLFFISSNCVVPVSSLETKMEKGDRPPPWGGKWKKRSQARWMDT